MAKRKSTSKSRRTLRGYEPQYPVSQTKRCRVTTPSGPGGAVGIFDVRKCAEACSSHFFDKGTMRFFGSRVDDTAYADGAGGAYFVTSEKRPRSNDPRGYSVRRYAMCQIETVGKFQGYRTKAAAVKIAKALAGRGSL